MSLSILVVDDNDINLKIASLMLKRLGHQADLAKNGEEAIKALENRRYDIVLMDIQMPEMDGIEATKIIRQRWDYGPKIIVVTALDICRNACFEAGADNFLTKPLILDELRASIENHMLNPFINQLRSNILKEITVTSDI